MIFRVPWVLITLVLGSSWTITALNGTSNSGSAIMKTLQRLVLSKGKTCPKKLAKFCKRESNLAEVLEEAVALGIEHCHEQFRYTRWNCTLNKRLFNDVSREASVVTAIFAASLSHTFARSCVGRKFSRCNQTTQQNLVWTGKYTELRSPGDDVKFGRRMAKRILIGNGKTRMQKKGRSFVDQISIHNVGVGLRAAAKMEETCSCQNYSPSCTVQICRKSLARFKEVAKVLRSRYTEAKMVHEGEKELEISGHRRLARSDRNRYYYTKPSPNFCEHTHGRECRDEMNCSILCCARGFKTREIKKSRKCRCVMAGKCCDIKCQTCPGLEKKHICK